METFWKTIAEYNSMTWGYQLVLILTGILLTVSLLHKPKRWNVMAMKIFFIVLYLWIAIVYFYICCAERSYNIVMSIFWVVLSVAWLWDLITGYTTFEYNKKHVKLAALLIIMPLLYPVASLYRGLSFPVTTTPVMPCSVVVFTIGILLLFSRKVNLFIVLLLCHWSLIGLSKTFFFNIPEDYMLAFASVPAIYLFFKEYYFRHLSPDTKPNIKYLKWLLIFVCITICVVLMGTMFVELLVDK